MASGMLPSFPSITTAPTIAASAATAPTERSIPPPTTTKNCAAEAIPMNVAPFSVSWMTGPARKVDDIEKPIASRIPSSTQAISVRGWRRSHSPRQRDGRHEPLLAGLRRHPSPPSVRPRRRPLASAASAAWSLPSTASRRIRSSLNSGGCSSPDDLPRAHDEDAVAHRDHLGQLGRDQQDAGPALDELVDQAVDLELRAHVDAARRLVEDDDLRRRLAHQPLPERDLLLVAAAEAPRGQIVRGGRTPKRRTVSSASRRSSATLTIAAVGDLRERREPDVAADGVVEDQAFALAVLRDDDDARARRRRAAAGSGPGSRS